MIRRNTYLACFLGAVLSCLSCSSAQQGKSAAAGATGGSNPEVEDAILQNERKMWEAFKVKDAKSVDALLAEEAQIVTPDGRFTKSQFLELIPQLPDIPTYSMENTRMIFSDKNMAILTYDSRYVTREPGPRTYFAYQTTVWIQRGGKWLAIFNQETPIHAGRPGPPATAGGSDMDPGTLLSTFGGRPR